MTQALIKKKKNGEARGAPKKLTRSWSRNGATTVPTPPPTTKKKIIIAVFAVQRDEEKEAVRRVAMTACNASNKTKAPRYINIQLSQ